MLVLVIHYIVVEFATDGNGCFGDWFERSDNDALTNPRVEHNGKEVYAPFDNSLNYGFQTVCW